MDFSSYFISQASPLMQEAVVVVIVWYLDLQLPVQSVPITAKVVSLNPTDVEVYLIQHYVIKFVSDLRQVGGFLRVLWFPPPNKTDCHDITEILLKVVLNAIALTLPPPFSMQYYNEKSILSNKNQR